MSQVESEVKPENVSFADHFSDSLLQFIEIESLPANCPENFNRGFLFEKNIQISRFVLWSLFTGVFVPSPNATANIEKYCLLKNHYIEKMEKHLTRLGEIESNDFENPLSADYKVCFELETKNQIQVDIVRIGFMRDIIQKHNSLVFKVLYFWSMENHTVGYRQGKFIRYE